MTQFSTNNPTKCVDCDAKIPYTNISSPIAQRCQDILMEYATQKLKQGPTRKNKYFNNKIEALHMKSKLFKIQKDYETSIFYIRKAIAINDKDKIQSQKILLIEMLLKQLERQYDEKKLLEVKGLLGGMNEHPSTKELNVAGLFSEWLAGYLNLCTSCLQTVLQQLYCINSNMLSFCQRILSCNVIMTDCNKTIVSDLRYISCIVKYIMYFRICNA